MNVEIMNHQIRHSVSSDSSADRNQDAQLRLERSDRHDGYGGSSKNHGEKIIGLPSGAAGSVMAPMQKVPKPMKYQPVCDRSDWLHHQERR
jgi:hypothetical protein